MLGKKSKPAIKTVTRPEVASDISGVVDVVAGTSRLPKGLKSFDLDGVGLGIVAALEKSGRLQAGKPSAGWNLNRSSPIPVASAKPYRKELDEEETAAEECTVVKFHGPNKSYTKVYCEDKRSFRVQSVKDGKSASFFHISPARCGEVSGTAADDFLSSCYLCHKPLHGEDIYMYRGEKAFCSTECRCKQIAVDEREEKHRSDSSKPVTISTSPLPNGQILATGILAA